jgi:hypothetical protein
MLIYYVSTQDHINMYRKGDGCENLISMLDIN